MNHQPANASCPCLLIAAPSSGSGKTTLTAALARWHSRKGRKVCVFKAGPDFIDPMILRQASGHTVYSLDLGMMSEEHCNDLLLRAASWADLILIEGVMGLFDSDFSAAVLAKRFNFPVAIIVDARAMAETFSAVVLGLATADTDLSIWGGVANRVASEGHKAMIEASVDRFLPPSIPLLATLYRQDEISFPERHLGLVQAEEIQDIQQRIDLAADQIDGSAITELPPRVNFKSKNQLEVTSQRLAGKTIAIAKDQAFSFVYAANVDFLMDQGATIIWTSPLNDSACPECDCLYMPGGYPELHLKALSQNISYMESVQAFSGHILAECGGMIYLSNKAAAIDGEVTQLCGRLPLAIQVHTRLQSLGWQKLETQDGEVLAHTFHYSSSLQETPDIEYRTATTKLGKIGEKIYQLNNVTASYLHWYFPSNPDAACALLMGRRLDEKICSHSD